MTTVYFRTTLVVRDAPATNADAFEVSLDGAHAASVLFEKQDDELTLTSTASFDVSESRVSALTELAANRLPRGSDLSRAGGSFPGKVEADGSFSPNVIPPIEVLPQTLIDLFDEASATLSSNAREVFALLRWFSRSATRSQPFASRGTEWSLDGGVTWLRAPGRFTLRVGGVSGFLFRDDVARAIARKIAAGRGEPLGHELFNEAKEQRHDNLRSAFVVTMMSLEVRVKEFIVRQVPAAQWLVEHLPAPPVDAILREYFPELGVPAPSTEVLRDVKKYVTIRNEVIHRGRQVHFEVVDESMDLVENLLLMLDYLEGERWAWPFIDDRIRATLTPPPSPRPNDSP